MSHVKSSCVDEGIKADTLNSTLSTNTYTALPPSSSGKSIHFT